jgi:hypothetical protein
MDIGSFVIDAQGERWAMDFGMQDYNSLETKGVDLWNRNQNSQRWEVFRLNNLAHNTLSFDGQLMNAKGYAKIDSWSDSKSDMMAVTDLSDMYEGQVASVKRGISIRDERWIIVRDEVRTGDKPAKMRWNLLTSATVKVIDGKTVEFTQNGKKMLLLFETRSNIEIKTWPTTPTHDYDAPNPNTQFVGFEVTIPSDSAESFNAIFSPSTEVPKVKPIASWK